MVNLFRTHIILAAAAAFGAMPVAADEVADFYKGKTVNFMVGYTPGGGYDTYTRLLANSLGKHIPGNPDVIVTNMPGGGSMKAANYTYNVAPKDGAYLGVFSLPIALEPLLGRKNAKFEALKFGWLGNMFRDTHSCVAWHKSNIKTLQDVIDSKEPVVFGATSAGSYGNMHARVLQAMVGANIKIVLGYRGIKGVGKALQQGEITAACAMAVSSLKSSFRSLKDSGQFRVIVQFGKEKHPFLDNATQFYSMLKNPDDVRVADFFFSQSEIARPVAAPPGIPAARLAALRTAFADALKDPALLARAKRIGIDVIYETPERVEAALTALHATPPDVLAKVKKIMGRK
ncbi:MAG: tripartite tricarboxylate transporter substrate-binding protein [Proteobacteria bacterium]|nr:tripartite tricarboxylate transporter substrate-binding protein [Pseudomonadota bacterium]